MIICAVSKTNYCVLLCLLTFITLKSNDVMGSRDDDDDEDPYTTTDPKKREPSPCESTKMCCLLESFQNYKSCR